MLIFLNQGFNQIAVAVVVALIGIASNVIECSSVGVEESLNGYLNPVDSEGLAGTDIPYQYPESFNDHLNVSQYPGELCNRVCVKGVQRVCYFEFTLEHYQAMGVACGRCADGVEEDCNNPQCIVGDGKEKGVMSINRQVPGPAVQVCKDDVIVIDVHNHASGTAASLHWHGLHMEQTPFMDGVPFVTQCPIPFSNTFRYQFYATQAGTQFYHAHAGLHKINGQYGALIVRQPEELDPHSHLYDYDLPEHYILISDWMHEYAEQYFPGLPSSGINPDSVLINGRGDYIDPETGEKETDVPPRVFYVTQGKRYRFRVISSQSHTCPGQLQIANHTLTIVSSDSFNVLPRPYETLITNAGERYDFILEANHTEGDFWMRFRLMGFCADNRIESFALLRYKSNNEELVDKNLPRPPKPNYDDLYPLGKVLNHPNVTCFDGENDHCITELTALEEDNELRYAEPQHKFYLSFQNYLVANEEIFKPGYYNHFVNLGGNVTVVAAINNRSLVFPASPLLTQPSDIDESQFCDNFQRQELCKGNRLCSCVHRLKIDYNSIVEITIVDESTTLGRMHHPFHMHGYRFMVTGMGQDPTGLPMTIQRAKQMERNHLLPRAYFNARPPFKDTVTIPSNGYVVLRIRAKNPGYWLLHCHYEWHLANGMALILQVGNHSEMVPPPPHFPACRDYVPSVREPHF